MSAPVNWNPPAYRSDDPEPELCASMYYPAPGGVRTGPMVCGDYVNHPRSGGPGSLHSGGPVVLPFFWTDEAAARSLVEFGSAAVLVGPVCTECEVRPQSAGGLCQLCADVEAALDRFMAESEAAAL